jgi:hypothetical protein
VDEDMSKISICVPTYRSNENSVIYLNQLFNTIRNQTLQDFDIVISDHSVGDEIYELVQPLSSEFDIQYIKNPVKIGSGSANTNVAIKNAKSKIIKIIYQDDLFFSDNYLECVVNEFKKSDKKWLVSACNHTDGNSYYRDFYPEWNDNILTTNTLSSPSTISVLKDHLEYFDEELKMLMDTDFYFRMFHIHGEPIYLNEVKISNREHENRISHLMQKSSDYQNELKKEIDYVYKKNQKLYFNFLKNNVKKSEYYFNYKIDCCGPPWFGACISWITAMYSLSIINGAKFYMASNDNWRLVPDSENNKNWHYFFESLELLEWKEEENNLETGKYSIRFEDKLFKQLGRQTESDKEDQTIIGNPLTYCPPEFSNPNLSPEDNLTLFKSFCLKEVYKPKKEYLNLSNNILENIGDYIAVHIRRGDKVKTFLKEGNFVPASNYHNYCVNVFKQTGIKNIFICSDSDEAISEFIEYNNSSSTRFNIFYDKEEVRHDGYPYKVITGNIDESSNTLGEMNTAFKNIEILTKANYLIGTPASWFFRISQLLRISSDNITGNCFDVESGTNTYLPTFYHC